MERKPEHVPGKLGTLDRLLSKAQFGSWKITPTLLSHSPRSFWTLLIVGSATSAITIILLYFALLNEMSSFLIERSFELYFLILAISFLVVSAILFYPLLLIHYRFKIYVEEETEKLNTIYREGLHEFQRELRNVKLPLADDPKRRAIYEEILQDMVHENPDYQDFAYLFTTYSEIEAQLWKEITQKIESGKGTYETCKKEILREIFVATAIENLEDSTYDLSSYTLPVSYCMIAVAFGFIITFLIPFLGTGQIQIGDTTISLVWASGGFIGAYIYSFLPFFQRCTRRDMPPRAFLYYALKVLIGPIAVAVFGNLVFATFPDDSLKFAGSVALGSVPFWLLAEARAQLLSWWSEKRGSEESMGSKHLFAISGITYEYAERLQEEGIMNVQNLAFADPDVLSKRTRLNRDMILNWKDQAILMLLTGDVMTETLKKKEGGQ